MPKSDNGQEFSWHESADARIMLPPQLLPISPFPELCARTKDRATWIILTITSSTQHREAMERIVQGPHRGDSHTGVEIVHEGVARSPYRGIERIVQHRYLHMPVPKSDYFWVQVLYLDDSADVVATVQMQGQGLFREMESAWQEVVDSFLWTADQAVVLKFDGDEIAHRARYAKKKRAKRRSSPRLPSRLRYLQSVIDGLVSLPPEQVNEDLDMSVLQELVAQRVEGLSLDRAMQRLDTDCKALTDWVREDPDERSVGEFIVGFLYGFELFGGGEA